MIFFIMIVLKMIFFNRLYHVEIIIMIHIIVIFVENFNMSGAK